MLVKKDFSEGLDHKREEVGLFGFRVVFLKATQMLVITSFPEQATLIFKQQ